MDKMLEPETLANLSVSERRKLLRALVAMEQDATPAPGSSWKWDAILVFIVVSCVLLAADRAGAAAVADTARRTGRRHASGPADQGTG
jgi:hypothetical protein